MLAIGGAMLVAERTRISMRVCAAAADAVCV
jgi:hypothetical protein